MNTAAAATSSEAAAAAAAAVVVVACSAGFAPKEMRREVDKCRPHSCFATEAQALLERNASGNTYLCFLLMKEPDEQSLLASQGCCIATEHLICSQGTLSPLASPFVSFSSLASTTQISLFFWLMCLFPSVSYS